GNGGSVFINDTNAGGVNFTGVNSAGSLPGDVFSVVATGNITTSGSISTGALVLQSLTGTAGVIGNSINTNAAKLTGNASSVYVNDTNGAGVTVIGLNSSGN